MVKKFKEGEVWRDAFEVEYKILSVMSDCMVVVGLSDSMNYVYNVNGQYFNDFDSSRDLMEKV